MAIKYICTDYCHQEVIGQRHLADFRKEAKSEVFGQEHDQCEISNGDKYTPNIIPLRSKKHGVFHRPAGCKVFLQANHNEQISNA